MFKENRCKFCQKSVPVGEQTDWRYTFPQADTSKWECYFGCDDYPWPGPDCPEYVELSEDGKQWLLGV